MSEELQEDLDKLRDLAIQIVSVVGKLREHMPKKSTQELITSGKLTLISDRTASKKKPHDKK